MFIIKDRDAQKLIKCSKTLSLEVIRGQWRSTLCQPLLAWTYFLCNIAIVRFDLICNMSIFWQLKYELSLRLKGQKRSLESKSRSLEVRKKKVVTFNVLSCLAFFWYILHIFQKACIFSKKLRFEVIRCQWRSAWGQSFDFKLAWTYFLCNADVISFHLICNMPIEEILIITFLT